MSSQARVVNIGNYHNQPQVIGHMVQKNFGNFLI